MGRKNRELTWHKARGVWRKKWNSKVYYLSKTGECKGEGDNEGYDRALLNWLTIKGTLEDSTPVVAKLSSYDHCPETEPEAGATPEASTLEAVIQAFLTERRQAVDSKDLSASSYQEAKYKLADFQFFATKYKRIKMADIDSHILKFYRAETKKLPPILKADGTLGNKISPITAKKRLATVRQFLTWAYRNEYMDRLPRNLDRDFVKVKLPDPKIKSFTVDEVRELFQYSSQRTRLYIALALNCGYGPTDISTLKHEHIFWKEGEIHRKRNKTNSPQHHKLWKITQDLLRAEMTDPGFEDLALLDANGKPLMVENLDKANWRTNPIGTAFNRTRKRADYHREKQGLAKRWEGNRKGIKYLRKTGAQTLAEQFEDTPHIVKQYLGHKEHDVVRSYRTQATTLLWKALEWMEAHFALDTVEVSTGELVSKGGLLTLLQTRRTVT